MHTTINFVQRDVSSQQCFLNIKTVPQIHAKNVGTLWQVEMAVSATHADRRPSFQDTGWADGPAKKRTESRVAIGA